MSEQLLVPIPAVQARLGGISRTTVWELVKSGHIKQVRIGSRAFITAQSITDYVDRLAADA